MSKENTITAIIDIVQTNLGNDYHVSMIETVKNNGLKLKGIMIKKNGQQVAPVVYIDHLISSCESELSTEDIARMILNIHMQNQTLEQPDLFHFTDFEAVKDRIIFQLINTERNSSLLETVPSVKFLDFSIIFKILFNQDTEQALTATITDKIMSLWNVSTETLYEAAMKNTPVLQKHRIKTMGDILLQITGDEALAGCNEMFVLSNIYFFWGSGSILYPNLLEQFADKIGMDFYILPSSVHEVLLVPMHGKDFFSLIRMVREVNRTMVAQEDFLSDNVYYYSRKEKQINVIQ